MEQLRVAGLMARHLRLQGALLALRRLERARPEATATERWRWWLERREAELRRVAELEAPRLAAETTEAVTATGSPPALKEALVELCRRSVSLMESATTATAEMEAALRAQCGALLQRLREAEEAKAARRGYGRGRGRWRERGRG